MAKTYRDTRDYYNDYYRHPKLHNEVSKLDEILHDIELMDYPLSGINHLKSRENFLLIS